jgi:LCP family protein required for cell wall assembly
MSDAGEPLHSSDRILRLAVAITASLSLVSGVAFAATAVSWYSLRNVGTDDTFVRTGGPTGPTENGDCTNAPCNFLLLGSDSRSGLSSSQQGQFGNNQDIGGETRADTIMVVHTDPETKKTVVLSFPRDLWVQIPGHGKDKINAAFEGGIEGGGPSLMRDTIQALTGITIDHYLYVDLNGFQRAVDTLGGVDLCIPSYYVNTPGDVEGVDPNGNIVMIHYSEVGHIVDPYTGLDVLPGCGHLDGTQALAYVRSRHLPCSAIPDFARIGRQQQFMRALINEMLKPSQIARAPRLVAPILASMHRDDSFYPADLVYLVGQMRGISTGEVQFRSVSGTSEMIGTQSVVKMDPSAEKLFTAIRDNAALPPVGSTLPVVAPSEANTIVGVIDAGNASGASEVEDLLSHAGFNISPGVVGGNVPKGVKAPAILYRPGEEDYATVVHAYLPALPMVPYAGLERFPGLHDAQVAIVVPPGYHPTTTGATGSSTPPPATNECPTP